MSETVLYYPAINIIDGAWLRKAVFYWDGVSSIVPDEYNPCFSDEIKYLIQEDLYYPTFPSKLFSYEHADAYACFEHEILKKLSLLENSHTKPFMTDNRNVRLFWSELGTIIYYKKFSGELYDYMLKKNYITAKDGSGWLEMNSKAAAIYMSTLAEFLAKISNTPMVIGTDKASDLYKPYSRSWPSNKNFCFTICFQNALPTPVLDVPLKKIVNFRKKRKYELIQLGVKIKSFENSISQSKDIDEIKEKLSEFKNEWALAQMSYSRMLKDDRIDFALSTMKTLCSTSVPGVILAIGTTLSAPIPQWVTTASLVVGGTIGIGSSYMKYRKDQRAIRDASGFAYLYDASNKNLIRPTITNILV